jgi:hypothetical protein
MDIQASLPITLCFSKATLAAGTTTTISTTGTTIYAILSKFYSKAAITNGATPTTDWATGNAFIPIPVPLSNPNLAGVPNGAAGYGSVYTVGFDSGGNVRVIQGTIAPLDASGNFLYAPQFGPLGPSGPNSGNNDFCPIGYIIVKLGSTAVATWTFGTNNLSGVTGVTYAFQDVTNIPGRPQIS